jgi:hypothetical protein
MVLMDERNEDLMHGGIFQNSPDLCSRHDNYERPIWEETTPALTVTVPTAVPVQKQQRRKQKNRLIKHY